MGQVAGDALTVPSACRSGWESGESDISSGAGNRCSADSRTGAGSEGRSRPTRRWSLCWLTRAHVLPRVSFRRILPDSDVLPSHFLAIRS